MFFRMSREERRANWMSIKLLIGLLAVGFCLGWVALDMFQEFGPGGAKSNTEAWIESRGRK